MNVGGHGKTPPSTSLGSLYDYYPIMSYCPREMSHRVIRWVDARTCSHVRLLPSGKSVISLCPFFFAVERDNDAGIPGIYPSPASNVGPIGSLRYA